MEDQPKCHSRDLGASRVRLIRNEVSLVSLLQPSDLAHNETRRQESSVKVHIQQKSAWGILTSCLDGKHIIEVTFKDGGIGF